MRQFAIGDIHGCNKTLQALLQKLNVQPDDEFYFLGDYINRGPDSKGVLDSIFARMAAGNKVVCLRGNHEQMMLDAYPAEPDDYDRWLSNGGRQTHQSFLNLEPKAFKIYLDFMRNMPLMHQVGKYILVHGGLNFNQNNPLSISHQMMWLRDWYTKINYNWLADRYVLHGHTPILRSKVEAMHRVLETRRVLNLDSGCVFYNNRHLACFELQTQELYFQQNVEDV